MMNKHAGKIMKKERVNTIRNYISSSLTFLFLGIGWLTGIAQTITIDVAKPGHGISPVLYNGMLFEEISHGVDGGFYAQLICNGSFENNNPVEGWALVKPGSSELVDKGYLSRAVNTQITGETEQLNSSQHHCLRWDIGWNGDPETGLVNTGYWGIRLDNNTKYKASFFARKDPVFEKIGEGFSGTLILKLESNDGVVYASSNPITITTGWKQYTCELTTSDISKVSGDNRFVIYGSSRGVIYLDVVSLMPPTYKNRPNGLRTDLAEMEAAVQPKLIRFPGGCDVESCSVDSGWNWKKTIGSIERRPGKVIQHWHYRNSQQFGLDELFQMCEDWGAEPIYCTSVSIDDGYVGVPVGKINPFVQDILDLIEYANGDAKTTFWGKKRAANGHSEPYNLKYIEIGNENGKGDTYGYGYNERYEIFYEAIKKAYPTMNVIINDRLGGEKADFIDEHFFHSYNSFLKQTNHYDNYDRKGPKIIVGEYCCKDNQTTLGNLRYALAEAAFLTGCEHNSDVVLSTTYATLSANLNSINYCPDLIYNNSMTCFAIPSYYMQKMFVENTGDVVLPYTIKEASLFIAPSIVNNSGDIIIKVVNTAKSPVNTEILLKGLHGNLKAKGTATILTSSDMLDGNSIAQPNKVVPFSKEFEAGAHIHYTFDPISVTVLRIHAK
jgi:alpha-L-arabinofuranosidase